MESRWPSGEVGTALQMRELLQGEKESIEHNISTTTALAEKIRALASNGIDWGNAGKILLLYSDRLDYVAAGERSRSLLSLEQSLLKAAADIEAYGENLREQLLRVPHGNSAVFEMGFSESLCFTFRYLTGKNPDGYSDEEVEAHGSDVHSLR